MTDHLNEPPSLDTLFESIRIEKAIREQFRSANLSRLEYGSAARLMVLEKILDEKYGGTY